MRAAASLIASGSPVEAHTDLGHRPGVILIEPEVRFHRLGTLHEERHCIVAREGIRIRGLVRAGKLERRHRILVLTCEVQTLPAAHQHLQIRARLQQIRNRRCRLGHLLKVVQQERQVLITQISFQEFEQRTWSGFLDPQCFGDDRNYQRRVPDRSQRDEANARGELSPEVFRNL